MSKILIVDPNSSGGHNTYCHSLSKILSENNNDIIYLNGESNKKEADYIHEIVNIPEKGIFNKLKKYYNFLKKIEFYFNSGYKVHFQVLNYQLMFVLILLIIKNRITITFTLHNLIPHKLNLQEKIKNKLLFSLLKRKSINKIFYHYEYLKNIDNSIVNNISLEIRNKMYFIPHHMFEKNINYEINLIKDDPVEILIFGVIRENKGIIQFFKLLQKKDVDIHNINFTLAGKFIDYSEEFLRKELNSLKNLNIKIINRFIDEKEKELLFLKSHYILLPYKTTFLAQSGLVLDAYQYKKPLIVSSNISLKYLVDGEKTGFSYDDNNLKKLFEKDIFSKYNYDILCNKITNVIENKYDSKSISSFYSKEIG